MINAKKGIAELLAVLLCVSNGYAYAEDTNRNLSDISFNTGSFQYNLVDEETSEKMTV